MRTGSITSRKQETDLASRAFAGHRNGAGPLALLAFAAADDDAILHTRTGVVVYRPDVQIEIFWTIDARSAAANLRFTSNGRLANTISI